MTESPRKPAEISTLRILRPHRNVIAFYDGRVAGQRLQSREPNWVDDGAYELGVCTYAVIDGNEALVYDTHITLAHAAAVRRALHEAGADRLRVVLSHSHLDHVAGNAIFADCEIIAHAWTAEDLARNRSTIETGTHGGPPAICPLVMPTTTYQDRLELRVGQLAVELRHVDIHSRDGTMLMLPNERVMLAGDALEDTCTYVSDPGGLARHLIDLERMAGWEIERILPNHGDPDRIAAGGYDKGLITATQRYVRRLLDLGGDPALQRQSLEHFVAPELAAGWITYFQPYEAVHRRNVERVLECAT